MEEYKFKTIPKNFYHDKVDPNEVGVALRKIEEKYGGLKPKYVVHEARNKEHALHNAFEWNDGKAAEKWREEQARSMIRVIVVEREYSEEPIRAFVSIQDNEGHRYMNFEDCMVDTALAEKQLQQAKKELQRTMEKWEHLKQLAAVWDVIRKNMQVAKAS